MSTAIRRSMSSIGRSIFHSLCISLVLPFVPATGGLANAEVGVRPPHPVRRADVGRSGPPQEGILEEVSATRLDG